MEAAVERRATPGSRIPFEGPVELDRNGGEYPIFADAINVGLGGLTLRSRSLPDLGQRLTCRFSPDCGDPLELPAEVVWASRGRGQYGVKFLQLDQRSERSLRSVVLGSYVPPPIAVPPLPLETGCRRVMFEGVTEPVTVRVLHEDAGGLTIEQELPFLALDTPIVTEEARAGRIETVELVVDRGVPRLVVDLVYDEPVQLADSTLRDEGPAWGDADEDFAGAAGNPLVVHQKGNGTLPGVGPSGTLPLHGFPLYRVSRKADESVPQQDGTQTTPGDLTISFELEKNEVSAAPLSAEPEPAPPKVVASAGVTAQPEKVELSPRNAGPTPQLEKRNDTEQMGSLSSASREPLEALVELPIGVWAVFRKLGRLFSKGAAFHRGLMHCQSWWFRVAMPLLTRLFRGSTQRMTRTTRMLVQQGAKQLRQTRKKPTTARPRRQGRAAGARAKAAAAPRRLRLGRFVVGGAFLLGGAVLLAKTVPGSAIDEGEPSSATDAAIPGSPLSSAGGGLQAPETRSATPQEQTVDAIPQDSPYAQQSQEQEVGSSEPAVDPSPSDESTSGRLFGEPQVENGKTFVLRMSQAVSGVVGTVLEDGFKVMIPGSLSLDRAGPIARAHDKVERSMILNHGDHAELTVRFAANHAPAYRVRPRGSSIEVTIQE